MSRRPEGRSRGEGDLSEQYQECDVDRLVTSDMTDSASVDAQTGAADLNDSTIANDANEVPGAAEEVKPQEEESKSETNKGKVDDKAGEDVEPEKKKATA